MSLKRNIIKTIRYGRKNGYDEALKAAFERVSSKYYKDYSYIEPGFDVLEAQKGKDEDILFSIIVPAFETPVEYLVALIESCINQTYSNFELIIADGSDSNVVYDTLAKFNDLRIRYVKLAENGGISENTNEGIKAAKGQYCCLLDHDDLITKDALYEVYQAIKKSKVEPILVYSDEDKCDATGTNFYEPHFKLDFNFDLILTNNYVCHLSVIKTDTISQLLIRKQYDGSQDYDLVLRIVSSLYLHEKEGAGKKVEDAIVHVPKVLYHWRCHESSTAENPESKMYAYEAGRKALNDFINRVGWKADIRHNKHLGFYRIAYKNDVLSHREDLAAIGGFVVKKGRIISGKYSGKKAAYAGYMNRLDLYQNVEMLDVRNLAVNKKLVEVYERVTGHDYVDTFNINNDLPDWIAKLDRSELEKINNSLSKELMKDGHRLLLDPENIRKV